MPHSNPTLIDSLRTTADRLEAGAHYEWGHMGRCNCGQLVQTLTQLTDQQIVEAADFQLAEWSEHAQEYCRGAGHKVDSLGCNPPGESIGPACAGPVGGKALSAAQLS
jgi:hypothetical protein